MRAAAARTPSASRSPRPRRCAIASIAGSSTAPLPKRSSGPNASRATSPCSRALHRERDRRAGRDRVEAELVAAPDRVEHRVEVVDAAVRPERPHRLVLARRRGAAVALLAHVQVLALHRAARAARAQLDVRRLRLARALGRDALRALELRRGEVARRQLAHALQHAQVRAGAEDAVLRRLRPERARAQRRRRAPPSRAGSAIATSPRPRSATALSRFAPNTAPVPPRPAWRPSFSTAAKRTPRSPATPIAQTRSERSPYASRSAFVVSRADSPRKRDASSKRTSSPSIASVVHASATPVTTIAASPQRRSTAEKWLDESPSFKQPGQRRDRRERVLVRGRHGRRGERSGREDDRVLAVRAGRAVRARALRSGARRARRRRARRRTRRRRARCAAPCAP